MSWHLPCYAARHAFGHALNANMLDEATEIVSNPRYLKLLCEYGSMRQCKMELEAHEATLNPPLKQVCIMRGRGRRIRCPSPQHINLRLSGLLNLLERLH